MSGDRERALRAGWEVNVSPAVAADEDALGALPGRSPSARSSPCAVVMAQMQACTAHDTNARLAALQMPTLVIHGTADQMLPVENGRLIASLIAGSRLEILDGVGHLFFWEQPERSAELIRRARRGARLSAPARRSCEVDSARRALLASASRAARARRSCCCTA